MADRQAFEATVAARLRRRAAVAVRPFDAGAITRQAVGAVARPRGGLPFRLRIGSHSAAWLATALLGMATVALIAMGLLVGGALGPRPAATPSAMPDGQGHAGLIVVSANPPWFGGGENGDIYVVAPGAVPRRIIGADADGTAEACPRFSADGRRLVYSSAVASGQVSTFRGEWPVSDRSVNIVGVGTNGDVVPPHLLIRGIDGSGPIPCAEWSPDGGHVAFRVGSALMVADSGTGAVQTFPITPEDTWKQDELEWSRDGNWVAVAEPGAIRIVSLDGTPSRRIPVTGATPRWIAWTSADAQLVYVGTDKPGDGYSGVHVIDADGTNDRWLSPPASLAGASYIDGPAAMSPDGTKVAYIHDEKRCTADGCTDTGTGGLIIADVTSGRTLREVPGTSGSLRWSTAGDALLVSSIDGLVRIDATNGAVDLILGGGALNLEWSSDQIDWQRVTP